MIDMNALAQKVCGIEPERKPLSVRMIANRANAMAALRTFNLAASKIRTAREDQRNDEKEWLRVADRALSDQDAAETEWKQLLDELRKLEG